MSARTGVIAAIMAIVAAVLGWFGGSLMKDALAEPYEAAIGVVDAQAGIPIESATPSPTPTEAPTTPPATQVQTDPPTPSPTEAPTPTITPTPFPTFGQQPCPGTPPAEGCRCERRGNNNRWVCPVPTG